MPTNPYQPPADSQPRRRSPWLGDRLLLLAAGVVVSFLAILGVALLLWLLKV